MSARGQHGRRGPGAAGRVHHRWSCTSHPVEPRQRAPRHRGVHHPGSVFDGPDVAGADVVEGIAAAYRFAWATPGERPPARHHERVDAGRAPPATTGVPSRPVPMHGLPETGNTAHHPVDGRRRRQPTRVDRPAHSGRNGRRLRPYHRGGGQPQNARHATSGRRRDHGGRRTCSEPRRLARAGHRGHPEGPHADAGETSPFRQAHAPTRSRGHRDSASRDWSVTGTQRLDALRETGGDSTP